MFLDGVDAQVLKKYACLWSMNRPASKRPKLYIVNLQVRLLSTRRCRGRSPASAHPCDSLSFQWTPKDDLAVLKIHGRCDDVMSLLMEELNIPIPAYDRWAGPQLLADL